MASRLFVSILFGTLTAVLATSAASAAGCTGNAQITFDLSQADPAWPAGDDFSIVGGSIQIKEAAGKSDSMAYGGALVGDADICVDASVGTFKDPTGPGGGVIFWQTDWSNYYGLTIAPNGQAAIFRIQNGKTLFPVQWRAAASLKTGANVVNNIRLTLKGNKVSAYFNDQLFYSVQGQQPQGGGQFGFTGWSEAAAPNVWTFQNLKVTDPSAQ